MVYSFAGIGERYNQKLDQYKNSTTKKRGGYLIIELAFWFVVMAIIAAIALGLLGNTDGAKVTAANQELDQIRTAVLSYQTYRIDGAYPDNLGDLLQDTTINAIDAIDGREHGPFLEPTPRWSTSALKDAWGNDYQLKDDAVYSTAGSSDSKDYIKVQLHKTAASSTGN